MHGGGSTFDDVWPGLAADQDGVVARHQLIAAGLTDGQARRAIRKRDWRTLFPGVYLTFTGPTPARARIWGALLFAGAGAFASHQTALYLTGVTREPPGQVHVSIPHDRKVRQLRGIRVHRSRQHVARTIGSPPRSTVEEAALDVAAASSEADAVLNVILRVAQKRLTTPARLADALSRRSRHRWRWLIQELIQDTRDGVESPLERLYLHQVERAHGLACGHRNGRQRIRGTICYWDVDYDRWNTLVELDGLAYHPEAENHHAGRKNNLGTLSGRRVLHYGWREVHLSPCIVAVEVAQVLGAEGWPGHLKPCGAHCQVRDAA